MDRRERFQTYERIRDDLIESVGWEEGEQFHVDNEISPDGIELTFPAASQVVDCFVALRSMCDLIAEQPPENASPEVLSAWADNFEKRASRTRARAMQALRGQGF